MSRNEAQPDTRTGESGPRAGETEGKHASAESTHGQPLPDTSDETSRSLLQRVKANETPAWQDLVHLYSPLVLHWCRQAGLSTQDGADINQEVFRSVVTGIESFRKDRPSDTFRGWLRTITRNKVMDHHRRTGRQPQGAGGTEAQVRLTQQEDDNDELASDEDDLRAEHELYTRAIEMIRDEFQPQTWKAFWGVVIDGRTAPEVADELGMKAGTVRVAKSRVLKRLRTQLGDLLD